MQPAEIRTLTISHCRDQKALVARIEDETSGDPYRCLILRRLEFSPVVCDALGKALRRLDATLEKIEVRTGLGGVEDAIAECAKAGVACELGVFHMASVLSLVAWRAIAEDLSSDSGSLRCLVLSVYLNGPQARALCAGLKISTTLRTLDISWSSVNGEAFREFANAFQENLSLRHLRFVGCNINDFSLAFLVESVEDHPALESLKLSNNRGGSLMSAAISSLLLRTPKLSNLDLSAQCSIRGRHGIEVSEIAAALELNKTLRILDLTDSSLKDNDAKLLADALRKNRTLRRLNLSRNKIGNAGVVLIADTLPHIMGLRHLSLSGNPFSEKGAKALAEALERTYELESLDLGVRYRRIDAMPYFLSLNWAGRRLLRNSDEAPVPLSAWPLVLERINRGERATHDLLYYMIRGPALFHGA